MIIPHPKIKVKHKKCKIKPIILHFELFFEKTWLPFKNSTVCCFLFFFRILVYIPHIKKQRIPNSILCFFGWGAGIRTPVMSESESDALPLGDTPIFSTLPLYHTFFSLSIIFIDFFQKYFQKSIFSYLFWFHRDFSHNPLSNHKSK